MQRYWPILAAVGLIALTAMISARAETGVASIRAGNHNCPHCVLTGADLTNQCVKGGDLTGANFDSAKLVVACMSKANFRGASFRGADLSGANLADSKLDDADLTGAILVITSIKGTDFSRAKGLTQAQLDGACGDAKTRLPAGLTVRVCE
ncbi:MAG: pentapeptide repeat-containing protein [Rhizomicrobium sp.]|nr:pentapeptide repeat-containing protein [Rhizomicrobium sp.]